jgi:outer membrane autotransporter protein
MMKKMNKKLAGAVVLGLMLAVPVGASAAGTVIGSMNQSSDNSINISGAYDVGIYRGTAGTSNYTGENIVIDITQGTGWGKGNVGVWATDTDNNGDRAVINLGNDKTNIISINVLDNYVGDSPDIAIGLWASGAAGNKQGGKINVIGNLLNITGYSESGAIYGIYAQNKTTDSPNELAEININTENTYINVSAGENALGAGDAIVAMSQGIININSNIEVYADDAIVARGDAVVKINESGEKTTKLNGDINFNYDKATSGTKVDADVTVNLTGAESYWNGNAVVSWGSGAISPDDKAKVSGMDLIVADGAQWNPEYVNESDDGDSGTSAIAINKLTANDGIINLNNMKDQELKIENLDGNSVIVNVASNENKMAITKSIAGGTQLTAAATSAYAENLVQNGVEDGLQQVAQQIKYNTGAEEKIAATNAMLAATSVTGVITADVNENGEIVADSVKEGVNTSNDAISNMASIALMTWRAENNDMNKRLGELRDSKGEHGVWARMVRGEGTYKSIKNQYNTYQLGYDEKLSTNKNWTVGAALSYTEGESSFNGGSGENKHTGLSVYGSYLNDDGSFIDLIAKYARLDHDFDVIGGAGSGDYETNGYSVSAEYGKRFKQDNGMWIEPQVELTYGKIGSANYMTDNGVSVNQDGMDSLVGRVGFALGKDFKQGNAYVRASYLYDFDGETDIAFTKGNVTRDFEQDLGGGWWEVGVGTNINLSDATHLYFDIEKTYGGNVATPWQWNAGVRYSF